ncbi:MAG: hypothetical protein OEZ43_12480 [Gammaproteobacteria bacterium]|nr:hypothetical protein [Gammaproteobacteria bacterium]
MKLYSVKAVLCLFVFLFISSCEAPPTYKRPGIKGSNLHIREATLVPFDPALYELADLHWGGRLYDHWWTNQDGTMLPVPAETATTHELWPVENTNEAGVVTWECSSCHGWDYQGVDGINGKPASPFHTGIKGIIPISGGSQPVLQTPEEVYNFLHDGMVDTLSHSFGHVILDDMAIYALTKFVITMHEDALAQRAPSNYINQETGLTAGVEADGATMFGLDITEGGCQACHGADGKMIDFIDGDPATQPNEFVDTLARENPWETLHIIRFGQPGSEPVFMKGLGEYPAHATKDVLHEAVNIVAYAQNGLIASATGFDFRTFQAGADHATANQPALDFARGGILYDEWWTAHDETAPLVVPPEIVGVDHALWTPAATNLTPAAGEITWRCKACHGWDYVGADGINGVSGSSYETGIKGIVTSHNTMPTHMEPVAIYDFIHSGTVHAEGDHAFAAHVSPEDLYALTRLVVDLQQEAMHGMAPDDFIDLATGTVTGGNVEHGQTVFHAAADAGGCGDAACHGPDGTAIDLAPAGEPPIFLHNFVLADPQEALHKIRFGNPGSAMPGHADHHDLLNLMDSISVLEFIEGGILPPPTAAPAAGFISNYYRR